MTDPTDVQRREVRSTANTILAKPHDHSAQACELASFILATVEPPATAPTLAEELRGQAEWARRIGAPCNAEKIDALASRAEQIEQENEEQREWNLAVNEQAGILARERDDARAEVERLNREQDRLCAQVQGLVRRDGDHNSEVRMLTEERDEARAEVESLSEDLAGAESEVERLTAVNEELRRTDNYREFKEFLPVQKGAESNTESIDPADVKPGEAWIVEVNGKRGTAMKDGDSLMPWGVVTDGTFSSRDAGEITLVSRLVPAPRVITDPDELNALAEGSIVRDRSGHAWEKYPDEDWYSAESYDDGFSPCRLADYAGPVTVLWEPGA